MKKMNRILVLSGGHVYRKTDGINVGDIAQLEHALQVINEVFEPAEATLLAHSKNDDCPFESLKYSRRLINGLKSESTTISLFRIFRIIAWALSPNALRSIIGPNFSKREFIKEIEESDFLLITGSGTLNDRYWKGPALIWTIAMLIANARETPVILLGQQIGPIKQISARFLIGRALRKAKFVGIRDRKSKDTAISLGVQPNKIFFTGDEGLYLNTATEDAVNEFIRISNIPPRFIAVQFRIDENCPLREYISWFISTVDRIASRLNASIVFFPFSYSKLDDDRNACKLIEKGLANPSFMVEARDSASLIKGILARADLAIGVANHFCVFAVSVGVPTVGLFNTSYMGQKLSGIENEYDHMKAYPIASARTNKAFVDHTLSHMESFNSISKAERAADLSPRYYSTLAQILRGQS
jgi:hypothetical protein